MRNTICIIIFVASCVLGLYVGAWVLFIKPILDAAAAFDAGILTGTTVALTVIKCVFAGPVGGIIAYIGILISVLIAD